ncbi:tetratricopeptide (TPR) repeat protein [Dysgonomonas hofstadii]|uniref:Tetratricopeptide (TPR) repeat protein n=1 Tax=Dysgonomonas hofstadii TaxID=637886 RepID=A0A840CR45_9BACT|nr:tetratricopeptide repeat protein [Dysgonomonas hofstadii]MBB4037139.1 tetratricopeptide (TPR) repeat protein [Dysgonomonas hofstadii]
MKKPFIFLILLSSITSFLYSQQADSELLSYINNFQYQKALEYIDTQEPTKEIMERKAFCYKALGNYKDAIEILRELSAEHADDIRLKADLATCYANAGKLDESINCYDSLICMDSTNSYFKVQKAELLYQQGSFKKALELYQTIHSRDGLKNMIKRSAQCFEKINEPDSAIHYYSLAWETDSTDSFSAANLINLNLKKEQYGNGRLLSDIYMQRDSTDKQINLLNALSYYMSDLYEEAIPRLLKCHAAGDTSVIVNRSLGLCYYSLKESFKAMEFLDIAYRQDTTNNNVLYCLAVSCSEMAEPERAITYFHKLLDRTIPPDLTLYLYYRNLAQAYSKTDQYQESADNYATAIQYGTDNQKMNLYYTIGDIYVKRLRNNAEALKYFRLYKVSINAYLENEKTKPEPDKQEIKDTIEKIKHLEEYITNLEKEING